MTQAIPWNWPARDADAAGWFASFASSARGSLAKNGLGDDMRLQIASVAKKAQAWGEFASKIVENPQNSDAGVVIRKASANVTRPGGLCKIAVCCAGWSRFSGIGSEPAGQIVEEVGSRSGVSPQKRSCTSFRAKRRGRSNMNESADDTELMSLIASGDEAAMKTLFVRHQSRVFCFINRMLRNEAIADELANEVFLEVWRGARKFQGRSSVTTWLLAIAHNRAVNVLRKRHEQAWNEDDAAQLPDLHDDPEVVAQKADKGALLRRCSDALSPLHREIIDIVYYHEMTIKEASEVLAVPEGTVKARLFKARKRLEELLHAAGVDRGWP